MRGINDRGIAYRLVVSYEEAAQTNGIEWAEKSREQAASGGLIYCRVIAYILQMPKPHPIHATGSRGYVKIDPAAEIEHLRTTRIAQQGGDRLELSDTMLTNLVEGLVQFV